MKSFLQGRPVQKSGSLQPLETTGGAEALVRAKHAAGCGDGVKVETVKEGQKVVKIVVTCSCGERIEIDCLYSGGA